MSTRTGFAGGRTPNPSYQQVCTKKTGHAETVEVVFDPRKLSFRRLLTEFFTLHDFTEDRRGNGGQYRSAIFYLEGDRRSMMLARLASMLVNKLEAHGYKIKTGINRIKAFYPAESRHQQYCAARGLTPKRQDSEAIREILTR
ncbi:hypothetical protein A3850_004980 [Lewinella sp. 4G2]|nr:hypothetical protein A3850_004980 [Lewinella sp. 4G2]